MASSILNSDDGVISGTAGLKSVGGDDGVLVFQSKGTETARINTDKQIVAAAGTASLPALTTTGDVNTGIFFPAADTIAFAEGGAEAMRIDSSGNLGLGVTPSAWGSTYKAFQAGTTSVLAGIASQTDNFVFHSYANAFNDNTNWKYIASQEAGRYELARNVHKWFTAPSGTAGNDITFSERMRITSGGDLCVGENSSFGFRFAAVSPSGTPTAIFYRKTATTGETVLNITSDVGGAGTDRLRIYASGNVENINNSYGTLSDIKLKQDIVDASSQWDDIKALRIVKYRLKNEVAIDPSHPSYIGLIAQEVEAVSPGLVSESPDFENVEVEDEDGNITTERRPTGTVTKSVKSSILYMKAVKALQEAMERIETLEAKNDALEARIAALEQA